MRAGRQNKQDNWSKKDELVRCAAFSHVLGHYPLVYGVDNTVRRGTSPTIQQPQVLARQQLTSERTSEVTSGALATNGP